MKVRNQTTLTVTLAVFLLLPVVGQAALLLDLKAVNFNATNGVWTDSSGNGDNATAASNFPTLTAHATPNGSSAVAFSGNSVLNLASPLANTGSAGFTVFAYEMSNGDGNPKTIVGGASVASSFQYRIGGDNDGETQELLASGVANEGHSTTVLGTAYHVIDVAGGSASATFRTDGSNDGTAGAATYNAISTIGSANGAEYFNGKIAEIEVYAGILTSSTTPTIQSVEQSLSASYVPEPAGLSLLGLGLLLCRRGRRSI